MHLLIFNKHNIFGNYSLLATSTIDWDDSNAEEDDTFTTSDDFGFWKSISLHYLSV